jgi:orotidine-5'-phosphate decarboxylase
LRPRREARDCIAVALDVNTLDDARALADDVSASVGVVKVGLELFCRFGPDAVRALKRDGRSVFLDLKLHDIPATVARSVESVASLDVDFLTVHATGGGEMLRRAKESAPTSLQLLAVTVLTSLSHADLIDLDVTLEAHVHAANLARLARASGINGFVCAAPDLPQLRANVPDAFIVTPGIRPLGSDAGDQKRIATAGDAIATGADLLVVGRPLRDAKDRADAARSLHDEVASALERVQ